MREFIVAEVSKNWSATGNPGGPTAPLTDAPILCQLFEDVIETNRARGYDLVTFQLHRVIYAPGELNETIVAVFRLSRLAKLARYAEPRRPAEGG